jgi:hypothetical protein
LRKLSDWVIWGLVWTEIQRSVVAAAPTSVSNENGSAAYADPPGAVATSEEGDVT